MSGARPGTSSANWGMTRCSPRSVRNTCALRAPDVARRWWTDRIFASGWLGSVFDKETPQLGWTGSSRGGSEDQGARALRELRGPLWTLGAPLGEQQEREHGGD